MSRARRHGLLAGVTLGTLMLSWFVGPATGSLDRSSLATAWLCLLLYAAVLTIGPRRSLAASKPIANLLPRRDLGIWAAIVGLIHFALGNLEAMNGEYVAAVTNSLAAPSARLRAEFFNWGAITGTALALILLVLLGISNNWALRKLSPKRWKKVQRLSYLGFALCLIHGLLFQILEARQAFWIALLIFAGLAVLGIQLAGRRAYRKNSSPNS